ncbi:MAG: cysteine--tRNA ligase [Candidatus Diapherotrites archaeon]
MLQFYNTLTRKKETFKPVEKGKVRLYCCGPTVYWFQHVGNLRTYVNEDVFRRVLEMDGFQVKHVMNLTDVGHLTSDADSGEDKMDKAAKRENKSPQEIADFYAKQFFEDCQKLNIQKPHIVCPATKHIPEMISLIQKLEKKGFTYETAGGIFFDTSKFKNYAKFAKLNLQGQKTAVREEVIEEKEKRNPSDFALWFLNKPNHILQWDSPWGKGFPGWHIECAAMSMKYLGETLDIHCGGIEHIPIHHTNEIAEAEAATGKTFSNYWMHNEWLMFKGEKMAKSGGGIATLSELEQKGFKPAELRFFYLQGHYRSGIEFSEEAVKEAGKKLEKVQNFCDRMLELEKGSEKGEEKTVFPLVQTADKAFFAALDDDFNVPIALHALFDLMNKTNVLADAGKLGSKDASGVLAFLKKADKILAVLRFERAEIPEEILKLVDERESARKAKNFKESDRLRDLIREKGFTVDDSAQGSVVKKA